ncbi:MAG: YqgE/AlgH family protein, partial [Pseudomonadota bacterium]
MTPLTGTFLLAMPGLEDPRFEHSVIMICDHSEDGAMGLIINKPADGVHFEDLLQQLNIAARYTDRPVPIYFGGPVEPGRGFVLHS